ncbi:MAG: hypothetical protein A2537_01800 [Candidatus Magasanikbacteria bacterium RIFOXYD2_FULL_36_9]|uniref:UDP-glucose 4-epimerase n=1 Tax=Candidatus Magasanikbacteria bacterium RIFOXYD2_FULL_36_9 TaxID=1798707 RepID=A0A1F6NZZ6_9BACT|nr:MAG: hypothetical protein A2537_01800 [Candidatus Magasanikbacteria bacterium RIFOXYD2_FULL_36_9]
MSKIVVTGGAGFIGSHLTDKLVSLGHQVVVIDNLMLGKKEFVNKKAKFVESDIRDYKTISKYFKGVEVVFHLAADPRLQISVEDPISTHEINVTGTLNVLTAAWKNKVKKVIFTSSGAVYGNVQAMPIKEDCSFLPLSPYGLHKLIGEKYCQLFSSLYGIETVCLRYFNVYGARKTGQGSYPLVIPAFLQLKKEGKPMSIVGTGKATRDYVHVSDVVDANIAAWNSKLKNGDAINIGSGVETSVNQIAKYIGGKSVRISDRSGEMKRAKADISKAKKSLGWIPKVKLEVGIKDLKKEWGVE